MHPHVLDSWSNKARDTALESPECALHVDNTGRACGEVCAKQLRPLWNQGSRVGEYTVGPRLARRLHRTRPPVYELIEMLVSFQTRAWWPRTVQKWLHTAWWKFWWLATLRESLQARSAPIRARFARARLQERRVGMLYNVLLSAGSCVSCTQHRATNCVTTHQASPPRGTQLCHFSIVRRQPRTVRKLIKWAIGLAARRKPFVPSAVRKSRARRRSCTSRTPKPLPFRVHYSQA